MPGDQQVLEPFILGLALEGCLAASVTRGWFCHSPELRKWDFLLASQSVRLMHPQTRASAAPVAVNSVCAAALPLSFGPLRGLCQGLAYFELISAHCVSVSPEHAPRSGTAVSTAALWLHDLRKGLGLTDPWLPLVFRGAGVRASLRYQIHDAQVPCLKW